MTGERRRTAQKTICLARPNTRMLRNAAGREGRRRDATTTDYNDYNHDDDYDGREEECHYGGGTKDAHTYDSFIEVSVIII